MYTLTTVLKTSRRLLLCNIVRYTFPNQAVPQGLDCSAEQGVNAVQIIDVQGVIDQLYQVRRRNLVGDTLPDGRPTRIDRQLDR